MHLRDPCQKTVQVITNSLALDLNDVPGGTMAQRRYPSIALIECVADIIQKHHKVCRLHLVIVDLWRSWKINQAQVRFLTGALRRLQYWGGPCSGRRFLVRFSDLILGSQDNGFIQERGVVAGTRVGVVILVPVFLGALVAVFLVVLVFFGRYLGCNSVPGQGLDSCVVVWLSFFVAVLVGPFVAVLVVVFLFAFV